jgi:hypothetical protein
MPKNPKLEEIIPGYLDGDMKRTALEFISYMRANKMPPAYRQSYCFKCMSKGMTICTIALPSPQRERYDNQFDQPWMADGYQRNDNWAVFPELHHFKEYSDLLDKEGFRDIIWDEKNMYFCNICNGRDGSCAKTKTVFGRKFHNLCGKRNSILWFFNPDENAIKCIKKILELEINARFT